MKRYEKESLVTNFLVFFSLLEMLLILLFLELHHTKKRDYKENIYKTMQVCSYTLKCKDFRFDFIDKDKIKLNKLYDDGGLYSFFTIPKSKKYYIKISYTPEKFMADTTEIKNLLWIKFIVSTILLFVLALFFTFYSLRPIRKALNLNDEFVKDILHDFNTPITSMVLNMQMFKEDKGDNPFIQKISHSIDSILLLQNNLKSFLYRLPSEHKEIDIALLAKTRLEFMQNIYPKITFNFEKKNDLFAFSNGILLTRILDNIFSNAAKYNKPNGLVSVIIEKNAIIIKDTGKGIKNINKVMQRYYKEQDRGLGLGLHIVYKLAQELDIEITIDSIPDVGTTFVLDLPYLRGSVS